MAGVRGGVGGEMPAEEGMSRRRGKKPNKSFNMSDIIFVINHFPSRVILRKSQSRLVHCRENFIPFFPAPKSQRRN